MIPSMSESETIDTTEAADAFDAPESGEGSIAEPPQGATDTTGGSGDGDAGLADDAESSEEPAADQAHDDVDITTESIVEALLFATDTPLPAARIAQIIGGAGAAEVKKHIAALNERYAQADASFRIEEIAGGFQMLTLPRFNVWLRKLFKVRRESRLSHAALETLAVVAYKQPVMRAVIEEIRGVAAGEVLQRLREMNLVKIVGRAEELGRPLLYGTTKHFLEVFGLASLADLPKVEELKLPPHRRAETDTESPAGEAEAESPATEATVPADTVTHGNATSLASDAGDE